MHSKIIQAGKKSWATYNHKGSCAPLVKYLVHEAVENKTAFSFFNADSKSISAIEAQKVIDRNIKGLRKEEVKFYSLVLSPSADELKHLQKGVYFKDTYQEKLKQYTVQAMENYAGNFNLKNEQKLSASDILWYATIHQNRQYKPVHEQVKKGLSKAGELKPGLHTHVHIMVSKRDWSQQITLNPQGSRDRFEIKGWQKKNEQSFDRLFAYPREVKPLAEKAERLSADQKERLHARISHKISIINGMLEKSQQLEQKQVEQIAARKDYSQTFFYNLHRLENNLRKGHVAYHPLHVLEHNKDLKPERLEGHKLGVQVEKSLKALASDTLPASEDLAMPLISARLKKRAASPPAAQTKVSKSSRQNL